MKLSPVNSGRFRYPRATPSPPIHNSPTTPRGTGSRCPSRTYIRVLAIGRPMVTSSDLIRASDDQIVVSVGPYIFQTDPQVDTSRAARSRSIASPPQSTLRRRSPFHPDSNNLRQV